MLHNQELKSKGENRIVRTNLEQTKKEGAANLAFLLSVQSLSYLVSFLANECGYVEIVGAPLHHGPR
jgi:hypothetical protein